MTPFESIIIKEVGNISVKGNISYSKISNIKDIIYNCIFNGGMKPLIVTSDITVNQYLEELLYLHLKNNLDWFEEGMDVLNYIERDDVKHLKHDLLYNSDGNARFKLIYDNFGSIDSLVKIIDLHLLKQGCNVLITDSLTGLVGLLPIQEQESYMIWQKKLMSTGISIINLEDTNNTN